MLAILGELAVIASVVLSVCATTAADTGFPDSTDISPTLWPAARIACVALRPGPSPISTRTAPSSTTCISLGAPYEQNELDRGDLGTPQHVRVAQISSLSYKSSDEGSESAGAADHNFIAPAQ